MDKIKAAEERNQGEIIYGECSRHPGNNIVNCIHCKTVSAALSTQSPKWVKASERLPEKNTDTIIWRGKGTIGREYYKFAFYGLNGNGYDDYDGIEWLDESPSSTHPLKEKIDGLREALEKVALLPKPYRENAFADAAISIVTKALETYK